MDSKCVENVDVVVVGGGPAGSTLASLVAMQGHRVIVLEKEKFPRYQIGESLLPSTVRGVCRLTGVSRALEDAGFPLKRGGTFKWGANEKPWTFSFSVSPQMETEDSYAYQVERSKFDKILLDHARGLGADVREECAVTGIISENDRVCGVSYTGNNGVERQIEARYVVDASGNKSRIYQQAGGKRTYSEFFRGLALFGYFNGGKRLPAPNSGNILCVAFNSGWFWYIPLSENLTSVGVVVRQELTEKIQGDPEKALKGLIAECPLIEDYLRGAPRIVDGEYGKLRTRKDYSYNNAKFWRPGMVLVGDAACFIDPVFSFGVHLATYSALLAARSINSTIAGITDEESSFSEFDRRYRREYSVLHDFLVSFYSMQTDENSYYWSAKKVTGSTRSELESFVDLVGGVSSGEAALTATLPRSVPLAAQAMELTNAVDEFVADDERSMLPWFKSSLIREASKEMTQIQALARLDGRKRTEVPLFENGLVPSADGMFWSVPVS